MNTITSKFGLYSALIAFIAAMGYCVVQLLQVVGVLIFPWDDILIYGFSLCIAVPFMLAMMALHYSTPEEKKIWSSAALLLSIMYAVYASFVYVVQLGVVIPHKLHGDGAAVNIINLSEQHSFFWSLDALTYICLGISTLFGAFVFARRGVENWVRWFFLANALLTPVIAFVYFYPKFSIGLLFLGSPWIITAPGSMLLLTLFFRRRLRKKTTSPIELSLSVGGKKVAEAALLQH